MMADGAELPEMVVGVAGSPPQGAAQLRDVTFPCMAGTIEIAFRGESWGSAMLRALTLREWVRAKGQVG